MVFAPSTIAVTAVAVITANVHLDYRPTGVRTLVLAHVAMARVHASKTRASEVRRYIQYDPEPRSDRDPSVR